MKRKNSGTIILIIGVFIFALSLVVLRKSNVKNIIVVVDGNKIEHKTETKNIGQVLQELNINIGENDKISKDIDSKLYDNEKIVVTRVDIKTEEIVESIDFETEVVKDYKLPIGEVKTSTEGENGEKKSTYNIIYEDGKEARKELKSEEVIKEPITEVIKEGIFEQTDLTVCVNRKRKVSADYVPEDLVLPDVRAAVSTEKLYMRKEAAKALEKLFKDAEKDGIELYAVSGYRSYSYQSSIYNPYSGYSAPPGASEHQLGLAMDVNAGIYGSNLVTEFGYTDEGKWVEENAHKYGFALRYLEGKEEITGYYYEPWHLRYLGVDLATNLKETGITLEEYYGEY